MYNSLDFLCKYQLQEQEKEETLFNEGKNITGYLVVLIMASTHKNKSYKLKNIYIIFFKRSSKCSDKALCWSASLNNLWETVSIRMA